MRKSRLGCAFGDWRACGEANAHASHVLILLASDERSLPLRGEGKLLRRLCDEVGGEGGAFRRDRVLELGLVTSGMEFASEMVVRASLAELRIREVPTVLRPDGRSRAPHLRTWRDGWRHLRFLLAFSPRWLLLYPSLLFQAVGLAGLAWLLVGPRSVGRVVFDVHSMLAFATIFVLGVQGVGLAVIARSYAAHLGLLAQSQRLLRVLMRMSLERGLALGGLFLLAGAACFLVALTTWGAAGFGSLDVAQSLRLPIVGSVLAVTGSSIITVSFTLSLTQIGDR